MGQARTPRVMQLLVIADRGGRNRTPVRLWKRDLQALAKELSIAITVCDVPPGTSRWNKIKHRLFPFITQDWHRRPLVGSRAIVQLIAGTTTEIVLKVPCEADRDICPAGVKVSDAEMHAITIQRHEFQGFWNYTKRPCA